MSISIVLPSVLYSLHIVFNVVSDMFVKIKEEGNVFFYPSFILPPADHRLKKGRSRVGGRRSTGVKKEGYI
jgi:hypothetical protein